MATKRKSETYMSGEKRRNTYTILEDEEIKWHWNPKDIKTMCDMWESGKTLAEIAEEMDETIDDTFLTLYDQARRGNISNLNVLGGLC